MLEVVDQRDHSAAMDPKRDAEGLLGLALGDAEVAEHPEVAGMEVEFGQAVGEAPMRVGAQLHEQEPGTAAQRSRRGCLGAGGSARHRVAIVQRRSNCSWYKQFCALPIRSGNPIELFRPAVPGRAKG